MVSDQRGAAFQEKSGGGGGDLLPGVCHLAHEVLVDVQLPQYRCCAGVRAPLTHWFDNRNVAAQLQVLSPNLRSEPMSEAFAPACAAAPSSSKGTRHVWSMQAAAGVPKLCFYCKLRRPAAPSTHQ